MIKAIIVANITPITDVALVAIIVILIIADQKAPDLVIPLADKASLNALTVLSTNSSKNLIKGEAVL